MKAIHKKIALLLVAAFALLYLLFPAASVSAFAAEAGSGVLNDLLTDEDFDVDAEQFAYQANDYSLHVIQIAESTDGELLVYVYQPSGETANLRASSINIARERTNSVGLGFLNYSLSFCNSSGVFFKYRVEGFELEKVPLRYYNISNILRPFDKSLGDTLEGDNTAKDVPYAVGQFWTVCTVNDEITYDMTETEVIEITDKYVGFVRYLDGKTFAWKSYVDATDSHFVAFSTDRQIDRLLTASITYTTQGMEAKFCTNKLEHAGTTVHKYKEVYGQTPLGEPVTEPKLDLSYDQVGGSKKYTWNRIERTEDFLKSVDNENYKLTKNGSESLDKTKWVLRFAETGYRATGVGLSGETIVWTALSGGIYALFAGDPTIRYTQVSDVMILQLGFETDGVYYNLGAVDNHQTGSGFSISEFIGNKKNWWKIVLAVIAVIVFLILLYFVLKLFLGRNKTVVNITSEKSAPQKRKKSTRRR